MGSPDFNAEQHREAIAELGELGVTWIVANGGGSSKKEALDQIAQYSQEIIAMLESS